MQNQLILDVTLPTRATLENFFVGNNDILIASLTEFCKEKSDRFVYLWGDANVGKSHLLQACCHHFNEKGKRIAYLPLANHANLSPSLLDSLENLNLLCIDDIEKIAGNNEWEEALFYYYNRLLNSDSKLLVSAKMPPQQLPMHLADLNSRLSQGTVFCVQGLTDDQKLQWLQSQALERGFNLPDEVARYLLTRCSRGTKQLFILLDRLDQASLSAQHKLTIPFVKQVLFSN